MSKPSRTEICGRIAELRLETAGPRGKAAFAKQLGLSPSTYDYYEHSRVPPADVLVKVSEVTGCDLRWLLTGQAGTRAPTAADHPVLQRAALLLADSPDAAPALAAFLDILDEARKFPSRKAVAAPEDGGRGKTEPGRAGLGGGDAGQGGGWRPGERQAGAPAPVREATRAGENHHGAATGGEQEEQAAPMEGGAVADRSAWIPILGRSAAGMPHFWAAGEEAGVTTLAALVARHAAAAARHVRAATFAPADRGGEESPVQIVTLSAPDERDVAEFIAAGAIRTRHPDAFALRIDGDSMSPEVRHGDLVICSPSVPAVDGRAAVVQLRGQIGVTCKLFRREGGAVHLVPVCEQYEIGTFPAGQVVWALRVLARVRP